MSDLLGDAQRKAVWGGLKGAHNARSLGLPVSDAIPLWNEVWLRVDDRLLRSTLDEIEDMVEGNLSR